MHKSLAGITRQMRETFDGTSITQNALVLGCSPASPAIEYGNENEGLRIFTMPMKKYGETLLFGLSRYLFIALSAQAWPLLTNQSFPFVTLTVLTPAFDAGIGSPHQYCHPQKSAHGIL